MNVEIGTEAAQFPEKEYINGIFIAVCTDIPQNVDVSNICPFPLFDFIRVLPSGQSSWNVGDGMSHILSLSATQQLQQLFLYTVASVIIHLYIDYVYAIQNYNETASSSHL